MTKTFPDRLRLTLSLQIAPGRTPEPARLKRLLKTLLRQYGMTCDHIEPLADQEEYSTTKAG